MSRDFGVLLMFVSSVSLMLLFFRMVQVSDQGHHWTDNLYEKVPPVVLGGIAILSGWGVGLYASGLSLTTRIQIVVTYGGAFVFAGIIPALALALLVTHFLRERSKKNAPIIYL